MTKYPLSINFLIDFHFQRQSSIIKDCSTRQLNKISDYSDEIFVAVLNGTSRYSLAETYDTKIQVISRIFWKQFIKIQYLRNVISAEKYYNHCYTSNIKALYEFDRVKEEAEDVLHYFNTEYRSNELTNQSKILLSGITFEHWYRLIKANVETFEDYKNKDREELLKIPKIGQKTLIKIDQVITECLNT